MRKGKKITTSSLLTVLGVICFATILVAAAITWATVDTPSMSAVKEVSLPLTTGGTWTATSDYIPDGAHSYTATATATYDYSGESAFDYYLIVTTHAGTGTIASTDFAITLTVDGVATDLTQSATPGVWESEMISTASGNVDDPLVFTIVPLESSVGLSAVYFTIDAVSEL
jgi:hypothetical protein